MTWPKLVESWYVLILKCLGGHYSGFSDNYGIFLIVLAFVIEKGLCILCNFRCKGSSDAAAVGEVPCGAYNMAVSI